MKEIILLSESGELCPETGIWTTEVQREIGQPLQLVEQMFLQKDAFPTLDGKPVKWRMLLELN